MVSPFAAQAAYLSFLYGKVWAPWEELPLLWASESEKSGHFLDANSLKCGKINRK